MNRTPATDLVHDAVLPTRAAVVVFLAFALAYFLSTLVRAITATLAPTLSAEFELQARDLGLLAGGYFLGFASTQLPLGHWLDRFGPKRVVVSFLVVAVLGCAAFAVTTSFSGLLAARVLTGMGVSACLMAPLTGYRRWLAPEVQFRANSWMLMTGSLGMLSATLPVQWLMPTLGWRGIFLVLAVLIVVAMGVLAWLVPAWNSPAAASNTALTTTATTAPAGYAQVWRHRYFQRLAPMGVFNYGGMVAVQTLWAGPWMVRVAGYTPEQSAYGLFYINATMLLTFWLWGMVNPTLAKRGWSVERLITWGLPLSFVVLASNIALGAQTGWLGWALFCVSSTFVALTQPAIGQAFPSAVAGRALSAYNLLLFAGVFLVQWGVGLGVDAFLALGWSTEAAFQAAMGVFWCACVASYVFFLIHKPPSLPDDAQHAPSAAR